MQIKEIHNKYTSSNIIWGRIKNQTLSSELDSSSLIITNSPKLDIQAYDLVELTNENGDHEYWLIADKKEEYITYTEPFKYQYLIELMSPTKYLEQIYLPNLTITNIGQNRTIYGYVLRAVNLYFKNKYGLSATLSQRLTDKISSLVSKEYTFSEPTLREYLDWLLSLVGAIITLKVVEYGDTYIFTFDYLDLSSDGTYIDTSYITDIFTGQDSDSYVSRIVHTSDDIVSDQYITEYLKESTTEPIFNTDTAKLRLTRKVYDFKSLKALNVEFSVKQIHRSGATDTIDYDSGLDSDVPNIITIDINDLVVSSEEYTTLVVPNPSDYNTIGHGQATKEYYTVTPNKYVTNTIMWDRTSNNITNIHYIQQWQSWWTSNNAGTSIENAIRRKIWEWFKQNYPSKGIYYPAGSWTDGTLEERLDLGGVYVYYWWVVEILNYSYDSQVFEVKYQPYFSPKIVEEHEKRNAVYSLDTNTNAKTNILTHLDRSKEKLNQLACDYKIMSAISKIENNDYEPKIKLGQVWYDENFNKFVLTKLETVVNKDHIQYKGTLALNFSNNIIDTSLNREKRYYAYANTDIVTRKENLVKVFKVSLVSYTPTTTNLLIPANYYRIRFQYNYNKIGYYLLPVVSVYNDRMISFEIQTLDNISVTSVKGEAITGGYENKVLKYVNDDGEFDNLTVDFGILKENSTQIVGKTAIEWASEIDITSCSETSGSTTVDRSSDLFHSITSTETMNLLKDNREQFNLTVQYIAKTDVLIANSNAKWSPFRLDRYLENLELYYKAVNQSNNPQTLTKPFKWTLTWMNGRSESGVTKTGDLSLYELFNTDFMAIYQASGGSFSDEEYIRLRITCNYLSNGVAMEIINYNGGYITPIYEDFI